VAFDLAFAAGDRREARGAAMRQIVDPVARLGDRDQETASSPFAYFYSWTCRNSSPSGRRNSALPPPKPRGGPRALAGRGASRSGSVHHACSVQTTSRAQNGARRRIIFFAATKVRIISAKHIEQLRRHVVQPRAPTMPGEILAIAARWQRRSSNANRLCCAISDFDPNGFRSSSPTTPATQSVFATCRG